MTLLAPTLEAFFTQHMSGHRQASPRTIGSYRDTWRLFLGYTLEKTGTAPAAIDIAALDAGLVSGFLAHLEQDRGNTARTRNARLAAIRSFFKFAALRHPEHAGSIARVLAVPAKKHGRRSVAYLTGDGPRPCSPPRTPGPGTADVTTRSSPWPPRPDCGPASSPASPAGTSRPGPGRPSAATARDARTASPRSPRTSPPSSATGSASSPATPVIRCSRPGPGGECPPTPSRTWPNGMPRPQQRAAHPSGTSTSPRILSDIPPPWPCCMPGSTPSPSPSGWVTKVPGRRSRTSMPTLSSRRRPWPGPRRRRRRRAGTGRPTSCSPSSKAWDYAAQQTRVNTVARAFLATAGIIAVPA